MIKHSNIRCVAKNNHHHTINTLLDPYPISHSYIWCKQKETPLKKIAIGGDHAGFDLKKLIKKHLELSDFEVQDFGPNSTDSCDYPDFAHPLADSVENGDNDLGILICGSANGVSMTANKHQGVRAAIAWNRELAELARGHNNANVVCLPSRFISEEEALKIVDGFLTHKFEGGRHGRRVDKISKA